MGPIRNLPFGDGVYIFVQAVYGFILRDGMVYHFVHHFIWFMVMPWQSWCSDGDLKPHGWHGLEATITNQWNQWLNLIPICVCLYMFFFPYILLNIPIGFLGLSNGWNTNTLWIASGNETCPSWDQNMRFEGSPLASASGGSCFGYFAYPMPYTILNY